MVKVLLIDPPSGWKYGFPKPFLSQDWEKLEGQTLKQWLLDNGYPQKEIDHGGAKYCRFITHEMEQEELDDYILRLNIPDTTEEVDNVDEMVRLVSGDSG